MEVKFKIPVDQNSVDLLIRFPNLNPTADWTISVDGTPFYVVLSNLMQVPDQEHEDRVFLVKIASPQQSMSLSYFTNGDVTLSGSGVSTPVEFQIQAMCIKSRNSLGALTANEIIVDPSPGSQELVVSKESIDASLVSITAGELIQVAVINHSLAAKESLSASLIGIDEMTFVDIGEPVSGYNMISSESLSASSVTILNGSLS